MSSIEERVKKIVVEQLGVKDEEVTAAASFVDDLGAVKFPTKKLKKSAPLNRQLTTSTQTLGSFGNS